MEEVNLTKNHLLLQCYHSLSWLLLKLLKCFNLEGMSMLFNMNLLNLNFHFCRFHGVLGLLCVFSGHGAHILLFLNEDLPMLRKKGMIIFVHILMVSINNLESLPPTYKYEPSGIF